MLRVITSMKPLNHQKLLSVYSESIAQAAENKSGDLPIGIRMNEAEQNLLDYVRDFLTYKDAFICLWELDDTYVAVIRVEPYKDGYLISGLETVPVQRRKGFGRKLLTAVIDQFCGCDDFKLYSHVKRDHIASFKLHLSCGFSVISDCAVLLDGSVFTDYSTLRYHNI